MSKKKYILKEGARLLWKRDHYEEGDIIRLDKGEKDRLESLGYTFKSAAELIAELKDEAADAEEDDDEGGELADLPIDERRQKAAQMREDGKTLSQIADVLGVSTGTVSRDLAAIDEG